MRVGDVRKKEQKNVNSSFAFPIQTKVQKGISARNENVTASMRRIQATYGFVNVQLFNQGFVGMTKNWLCNVKNMSQLLNKTLFIATDTIAYDNLRLFDPNINVVLLEYRTNAELSYGEVSYFDYMLFRTKLILLSLESNFTLWLTESDATWIRDPSDLVKATPGDIVGMSDLKPPKKAIQGGFILLRPTQSTKNLWKKVLLRLEGVMAKYIVKDSRKYINDQGSEQLILGRLLETEPIRLSWMDQSKVVSGAWYNDYNFRRSIHDPVIILNNWVIGNGKKIARAKVYGHWFLNAEEDQCNSHSTKENVYPPVESFK